ncbi:uncharacterized protein [Ptychodera flava]|uniref:uncharacterized protein n=1 Tax=Ptychodera flava TaxID=63121 RepID=UPI00396A2AC2
MSLFCTYSHCKVLFALIVVACVVATTLFSLWEIEPKMFEGEVSKYQAAIDTVVLLKVETPKENTGSEFIEHSVSPSSRRTETKVKTSSYFLQNHSFTNVSPSVRVGKGILSLSETAQNTTLPSETVTTTISPSTGVVNTGSSSGSVTKVSSRRFLVSVHYDINGPNVHYEAFRAGLAYAVQEKRTIVESFFYTHWTQGHNKTRLKRQLNETFDLSKLRQIVDYATVAEFNRECNNTIELLLVDPAVTVDRDLHLDRAKKYLEIYNIKLPTFADLVASQGKVLPSHSTSSSVKCLGVYEPSFWTSLLTPEAVLSNGTIDRHLVYAKPIRRLGKTIASIMCNGNDYMALHWRNKSGEACGRTICSGEMVEVVAAINKTAIVAATDIKVFMGENNLSCIYVALPPFARPDYVSI